MSDKSSALCFDDPDNMSIVTDEKDYQSSDKGLSFDNGRSEPMIALPFLTEEKFGLMLEEETSHLPKDDYLMRLRKGEIDISVRRQARDWILKVC